jgi:membrane protein
MFGRPLLPSNALKSRLRDLGVLVLLGLSMLVSAVLAASVNGLTGRVLDLLGLSSHSLAGRIVLPIVGFFVVLAVDIAIFVVLLRLLSGVSMRWADLRQAAIIGGLGVGILKVAVSYGVVGSSTNPLLASFAIVIGLLVVMNLMSRVTLIAAAWAATDAGFALRTTTEASAGPTAEEGPRTGLSRPRLPHPAEMEPSFGTRSADRTAIAAGAVLGATAAVGAAAVRRAAGSLLALARRH